MAINKRFTQLNNSGSNHNLLDAYSGKITGSFEVTGAAHFPGGLSGSLTTLENGSPFIIGTGIITVTSVSNGAITINGTATSVPEYFYSATNDIIEASGSLYVSGAMRALSLSASNGAQVTGSAFFNDNVTLGSSIADIITVNGQLTASSGVAVTGNAVFNDNVILGSSNADIATVNAQLTASAGLKLTGSSTFAAGSTFTFNGNGVFVAGLTGSLQEVSAGVPYLLAGDYITLATNSLGQIAISASNIPGLDVYWSSEAAGEIFTSASLVNVPSGSVHAQFLSASNGMEVTGAAYFSPAGTGRGLLNFGGLDIGPITGSLYMPYTGLGTENGVISGSVLSASNGVWDGTNPVVLRHELHVLGLGVDDGLLPVETFAATYLVMTYIDSSGVQTVKAVTELSRETSGSRAATYDINFAPNGNIEATGSVPASYSANIKWYVQRVKEMSLSYDLTLT
jgi:hypothetical protein